MMVKGFLKSSDGIFQLSPRITVVGRENSDLVIQSPVVEPQHAIIEYSDPEGCFVLQDLNTAHGTYVNDCRVQNAAVRLAPGDIIRFGYAGVPQQLEVEDAPQISYPPVHQRLPGSTSLTVLNSAPTNTTAASDLPYLATQTDYTSSPSVSYRQLPHIPVGIPPVGLGNPPNGLGNLPNGPSNAWAAQSTGPSVIPRPPRPRPSSAGTRRGSSDRVGVTANSPTNSPLPPRRVTGGWVSSVGARSAVTSAYQQDSLTGHGSPVAELNLLHEKDQKILRMGDEINRLAVFEAESVRKDGVISQLRDNLEQMNLDLQQAELAGDSQVQLRVMELEKDSHLKQLEITALKQQMTKMRLESSDPLENVGNLRALLNQKDNELASLRHEIDGVRKEKTTSNALVATLQRDLSNKDALNRRMKGETALLRNQLRDREVSLSAMTVKFSRVKECKKQEEELAAKSKEVVSLKSSEGIQKEIEEFRDHFEGRERDVISHQRRLKGMEAKIADLTAELATKTEEITKQNEEIEEDKKLQVKYLSERDSLKDKFLESQRSEKAARVDKEQALKRLDRFRGRVMQIAFSAPGFKVPEEEEVSDDTVAESIKHLVEERTEAKNRVRELRESSKSAESGLKGAKNSAKALKTHLTELELRLSQNGRTCPHIREEIRLLQSVTVDETFQSVRDTVAMMLQNELSWQQEYEQALEKCGFEIKGAEQNLSTYIEELNTRAQKASEEKELLSEKLSGIETGLRQETEAEISRLKTDHENRLRDALERAVLLNEQKLQTSIEETRQAERLSLQLALDGERQKVEQRERSLEELRKALTEKNAVDDRHADREKELQLTIDQLRAAEQEGKKQLSSRVEQHRGALAVVESQLQETISQKERETKAFKEQIHQHSLTIVNLEERINQMAKTKAASQREIGELRGKLEEQAKQAQAEMSKLREAAATQSSKPPPVPQTNHNLKALEQVITVIRRENAELKKEVQDQQDVVLGLRRDLAGASARLSDTLSRNPGRENAELKKEVQDQQDVVLGLRRDLAGASARLSDMTGELSDQQKEEMEQAKGQIRQQDAELTTQRQQLVKLSEVVDSKTTEIDSLAKKLESEKEVVVRTKRELSAHVNEVNRLKTLLTSTEEAKTVAWAQVEQGGIITNELSGLGAQCRGERHEQVIARQREALAELRQRIKGLESNRPPLPTQDQALQQVLILKKELAEMRAKQAQLASTNGHHQQDPDVILDHEVAKARGQLSTELSNAAIERSARVEMQEAMNLSEKAYIGLAQTVCRELGLGDIPGLDTFAHLPKDERDRLDRERDAGLELIAGRLRTLNQRLDRKDELLKDYEKDLEKLRLAEQLANQKAEEVESLATDVRGRTEEAHYLRETLRGVRESLDHEKRLNSAIKNKKTFHLENDDRVGQKWPRHKCYDEEAIKDKQKQSKKTKAQKDKMMKKNYELETIKAELQDKDQQLIETTAKLINLENAIGMTS